jgi:putative flippase GtrA
MALTAPGLYSRVRTMLPEMIKFGVVGGLGTVVDLGGAALLQGKYHVEPLAAKAISVSIAMVLTYLGSRFWTFKERENQSVRREAVLFLVLNVLGLLMAEAVIGLVTYGMGLHGHLAYNAASFIGTGFGTIFRFWAYRKWVFLAPEDSSAALTPLADATVFPDYPPWELDPSFLAPLEPPAHVPAAAPVAAPVYAAPWARELDADWDPALAPTMSWGVPPALAAPVSDVSAPDLPGFRLSGPAYPAPDFPAPPRETRRPSPAPSRPRSSGGGRHRKS